MDGGEGPGGEPARGEPWEELGELWEELGGKLGEELWEELGGGETFTWSLEGVY